MDTQALRIAALSADIVDGFEPQSFADLHDPRGPRILVSSEDRSVVASVLTPSQALESVTEQVAAAVLRSILPTSDVAVPRVHGSAPLPTSDEPGSDLVVEVSDPLPGIPLSTTAVADSSVLRTEIAVFLASLHSSDAGAVADAGLPSEEPQEIRENLLAELDRGAQTGEVPGELLSRWEHTLESVSLWRFLPSPIHADLSIDALRSEGSRLRAVSDLARLRVGDPAVDLAALSGLFEPDAFAEFVRSYMKERKADDPGLLDRVEFLSEFAVLQWFLAAVEAKDEQSHAEAVELLRQLAAVTATPAVSAQEKHSAPAADDAAEEERADASDSTSVQPRTDAGGDENETGVIPTRTDSQPAAGSAESTSESTTAKGTEAPDASATSGSDDAKATVTNGSETPDSHTTPQSDPTGAHVTASIGRDRAAFRPSAAVTAGDDAGSDGDATAQMSNSHDVTRFRSSLVDTQRTANDEDTRGS